MSEQEGNFRDLAIRLLVMSVVLALAITAFMTIFNYTEYSKAYWGGQICEEKYGDNADYVGEPSAFSSTGICEYDGEQSFIEVKQKGFAPVGPFLSGDMEVAD